MKILAYNSSARGSGQFVRSLKIAELLTTAFQYATCVILVGNSYFPRRLPSRTRVIRMPEIRKSLKGDYTLVPSSPTPQPRCISEALAMRKRIIESTVEEYDPDVFLVDSRPAGLNDELLQALGQISARSRCKTVLILRDIVDSPDLVTKRWAKEGTYTLIDEVYDRVVVLGEERIFDVVQNYGMSALGKKVSYLGYLGSPRFSALDWGLDEPGGAFTQILVTTGGGFDGGRIVEATCQYICNTSHQNRRTGFSLVLGANSKLKISTLLKRYSNLSPNTKVYGHVKCLESLIDNAHMAVSMCGYNTLIELIERRKKIIAVPRTHSGSEQIIRASLFRRVYDGMWVIPQNELNAERLERSIDEALAAPRPTVQMEMRAAKSLIAFLEHEVGR